MIDKTELSAIKARLGALSPRHMQSIRALSEGAFKLLSRDLPFLIENAEGKNQLSSTPKASATSETILSST